MDELNEHVDRLTYPLLFPTGLPPGWCPDIVIGRTVTHFCAREIEEMNKFEASAIIFYV